MNVTNDVSSIDYELVSGLEIHVQLNTRSKIFSSDSAAFGAEPNSNISPVSLALPGALPKLNKEVVAKAVRMGLALNCTINQVNYFDRKNYFYADLPKGYQITQDNKPICQNGFLDVKLSDGLEKRIGINRIHLEEDAGKSLHDQHEEFSFVDLNRAGVPLIEIVTEPDIRSAEEASALLTELRKLVRFLDVSDGNMEEGSLRCDANISIRKYGTEAFGTRCEVKNLNSIRNVRRAIEFEFGRQKELISAGGTVVQSTLNFDAEKGTTSPMRSKEEANDYRYFPDPDLAPIHLSEEWLAQIKFAMPALPDAVAKQLVNEYHVSPGDAVLIAEDQDLLKFFYDAATHVNTVKMLASWLCGPVRAFLNERHLSIVDFNMTAEQLADIINLVNAKRITQQNALSRLLPEMVGKPDSDAEQIAEENNLLISDDAGELERYVDEVLNKFAPQVQAYKKGKKGVLGLFVGEVMKLAKGKANPQTVNQLLNDKLN